MLSQPAPRSASGTWFAAALALAGAFSLAAPSLSPAAAQSGSSSTGPDRRLVDAVQQRDFETARGLLAAGGGVNVPQGDGATALAWAAHWDEVDLASKLIAAGADVGAANDLGVTPLMLAAANGSLPLVELLLAAGAAPDAARPTGDTALMFAARAGSLEVVRRLAAAGANPNARTAGGHTALMWAAAEAHAGVAQALIDHGAALVDVRTAATPFVPRRRRPRRGPILLREGEAANPAEFPRDGETDPPRTAGGFTPLLYAVLAGDGETVRVLLDAGADVNDASPDGVSALMLALTKRHEDLALLLLDRGADPNYDRRDAARTARARAGGTRGPATVAAAAETVDFAGYTALHVAAATGQHRALRALLAAGAAPDAPMDRPKRFTDAFEVGVFASPGAGRLTQRGTTPFMVAAKTVDVEAMRILAAAGADPFATTDDGTTALILAAGTGQAGRPGHHVLRLGPGQGNRRGALRPRAGARHQRGQRLGRHRAARGRLPRGRRPHPVPGRERRRRRRHRLGEPDPPAAGARPHDLLHDVRRASRDRRPPASARRRPGRRHARHLRAAGLSRRRPGGQRRRDHERGTALGVCAVERRGLLQGWLGAKRSRQATLGGLGVG